MDQMLGCTPPTHQPKPLHAAHPSRTPRMHDDFRLSTEGITTRHDTHESNRHPAQGDAIETPPEGTLARDGRGETSPTSEGFKPSGMAGQDQQQNEWIAEGFLSFAPSTGSLSGQPRWVIPSTLPDPDADGHDPAKNVPGCERPSSWVTRPGAGCGPHHSNHEQAQKLLTQHPTTPPSTQPRPEHSSCITLRVNPRLPLPPCAAPSPSTGPARARPRPRTFTMDLPIALPLFVPSCTSPTAARLSNSRLARVISHHTIEKKKKTRRQEDKKQKHHERGSEHRQQRQHAHDLEGASASWNSAIGLTPPPPIPPPPAPEPQPSAMCPSATTAPSPQSYGRPPADLSPRDGAVLDALPATRTNLGLQDFWRILLIPPRRPPSLPSRDDVHRAQGTA